MREEDTKKMKALNIVILSYCGNNGPSICATFAQLSVFLAENIFIIREIPIIIVYPSTDVNSIHQEKNAFCIA
jgi:hypothetical protein